LDAEKVYDSGDDTFSVSKERFFLIGELWIATMEGEALPDKTYNHVAFKIDNADFNMYLKRIQTLGLQLREGRSRVEGEGQSIYFYDDDNHMFELHAGTLDVRLKRYENSP
jgi:catechol 2,3-dioxygenase-like lactoylglutathione lyase family enzyme